MSLAGTAVADLVERIRRDDIGGAAEMATEVATAIEADIGSGERLDREVLIGFLRDATRQLLEAAPSVMPVTSVLHEVSAAVEADATIPDGVLAACVSARERITRALDAVGDVGGALMRDGERVFTYSTSGSVYECIRAAVERGKRISVVTTESRPGREGLRTIELLEPLGVPVTMGIDGGVAGLLRGCTSMWVGADTVSSTGDALCKTGTLPAALAASVYGVPVRVVADGSKYDPLSALGWELPIRELDAGALLAPGELGHATVSLPLFEIVPARYIDAFVTDAGVLPPAGVATSGGPTSALVVDVLRELLAGPRDGIGVVHARAEA